MQDGQDKLELQHSGWMLYGATGYTGQLMIEQALKKGMRPLLAGRDERKLASLSEQYQLPYVAFELTSRLTVAKQLEGISLVLHCAGPFSATAKPMMSACLTSGTHYLDITGEMSVFQHAKQLAPSAIKAGIVICPGVGFDVVPTDCVAATLKEALPDASSLWLGFDSRSGLSPGTAKTSVEGLKFGGKVRQQGVIKSVPLAYKSRQIDFGDGTKNAITIPWGDVATAYYSTGIPNVEVYIPISPKRAAQMKKLNLIRGALGWGWVQNLLKRRVDKTVVGPDEATREQHKTFVWGEAVNLKGDVVTARLTTPNGYDLTVSAALGITQHILDNQESIVGDYYTPSMLMGADYVTKLPGCSAIEVTQE